MTKMILLQINQNDKNYDCVYLFELLLELDQCGCVCLFVCLFQFLVELDQGGCVYLNF